MPSTPIYGFPYPDNVDLVRDGHQDLQDLATAVEDKYNVINGLVTLNPSGAHTNISFDENGVGRPTVGASTFTIADCFSSSYFGYRIVWAGGSATANNVIRMSYPGFTSGYRGNLLYNRPNNATPTSANDNNVTTGHTWIGWSGSTQLVDVDVIMPFGLGSNSTVAYVYGRYMEFSQLSGAALGQYFGWHYSGSFNRTSVTFTLDSGVIVNSGTVRVYAYNR